MQKVWIGISALAVGFGIWATHFVAMLSFRPGFALSYDIGLTALSLLMAIVLCGAGIGLAIWGGKSVDRLLGGAVIGVGISSMHYVGIAALVLGGNLEWNGGLVGVSILSGLVLSSFAVRAGLGTGRYRVPIAVGLLTVAICAMHFTAMGAADFSRCFPIVASGSQVDGTLMSLAVALISFLIVAAAVGGAVLDEADRRRTERERERERHDAARLDEMRSRLELALAHMEQGLALFGPDQRVLLHNQKWVQLLGFPADAVVEGEHIGDLCRAAIEHLGSHGVDLDRAAGEMCAHHLATVQAGGGTTTHSFGHDAALRIQHSPTGDGSWVTTIEDISESKRNEAAIAHLAQHDALTGLANRARFNQLFDAALAAAENGDDNLAVIQIDLDRFKEVNDSYGHAAGDEVLRRMAERLTAGLREGEVVARLGGDEFAALKPFTSMDSLRDFLKRIEAAVFGQVTYQGVMVNTGGSIGVAIYPDDGADRSKLLNNADLAMYRAKAEFDTRICYYEREMDEHARQRRAMAHDLWVALEKDAFDLVYQVQKSVSTGEVTGYEVLLRWDRPGHGLVSPTDFIPLAEETGSIGPIGAWVLKTACLEAASWPEPYKIAVNVSGLQLAQLELVDLVRMVLFQSGLEPERLELEVTETAIIADKKRALYVLRQIKAMGVSIAIDDFGTGYSSLDTLRSFPFDKIKLDRSFMVEVETNEQSKAIIRAILALGRSLSVPVLAEGVETHAQLDVLRDEGCNEAQGFLLGRPGNIDWADLLDPPLSA
nr:EAL domain-containing protein [Devosia oryzisoli]